MSIRRVAVFAWLIGGLLLGAVGGAGADSATLRDHVFAEYPRLDPQHSQHEELSEWDQVCMLREFSYRHTNYANDVEGESYLRGAAAVDRLRNGESSLAEVYAFFDRDGGGVVCGHAALLLERLYRAFGYEAWSVGVGFGPPTERGSRFTHVQVLVRIRDGDGAAEREILTLHDPSTNAAYVDARSRRPLDYLEVLHRLVGREADSVATGGAVADGKTRRDPVTIAYADETAGRAPGDFDVCWNVGSDYVWEDLGAGKWKFSAARTPDMFGRLGDLWWKSELVAEGLPPNPLYLHLFFQAAHANTENRTLGAAVRAIVQDDPAAAAWYREQEAPAEPVAATADAPEPVLPAKSESAVPAPAIGPTWIELIPVRLLLFIGLSLASLTVLVIVGRDGLRSVWTVVPPVVATGLAGGFTAYTQGFPRPAVLAVLLVAGPASGWVMHKRAGRHVSG